jgi:Tol biopolymer transport system component
VTPPTPVNPRLMGRGTSPAWSPDGQFIAYLSHRRGAGLENLKVGPRVICIRSLKTGEERELSTPLSFETTHRLQWSPDGRFLLATGMDIKGRGGLYRIAVESGEVVPVVQGASRSTRPYGVWSPDGKAIFYNTRGNVTGEGSEIRVRDLETGRETEIYRPAAPSAGASVNRPNNLALSPDGQWLAFGLGGYTTSSVLMVMPAVGGEPRELLRLPQGEGALTGFEWAGDGKHLLFTKVEGGGPNPSLTPELWRISVEGGALQKVGLATQNGGRLAIHPDGRQIAFTAGEVKEEVWVMENFLPALQAGK